MSPSVSAYVDVSAILGATLLGIRVRAGRNRRLGLLTSEAYLLLSPGRSILFPNSGDSQICVASPPALARRIHEPRAENQVLVALHRQTLDGQPDCSESAVFELANGMLIAHQSSAPIGTGLAGIEVVQKSTWLSESTEGESLEPF